METKKKTLEEKRVMRVQLYYEFYRNGNGVLDAIRFAAKDLQMYPQDVANDLGFEDEYLGSKEFQ